MRTLDKVKNIGGIKDYQSWETMLETQNVTLVMTKTLRKVSTRLYFKLYFISKVCKYNYTFIIISRSLIISSILLKVDILKLTTKFCWGDFNWENGVYLIFRGTLYLGILYRLVTLLEQFSLRTSRPT